ncbi:MAG: mercury resistance system transport protein MerF [Candidatus Lambdaproteobacteria bacterium]
MKNKTTFYGGIGTVLTALCCFTPILVIGLTGLGAVSIISYLDYVLFPVFAIFAVITVYGIYRNQQENHDCERPVSPKVEL